MSIFKSQKPHQLSEQGYAYLIMGHPLGFGYQLCTAHLAVTVCEQILIDIGGLHQAEEKSTGEKGEGGVCYSDDDAEH